MLISCSICKELFFPNSEVCGTKCGHIYHETCLKKWQERSGSCPQCRTKLRDKPHRIYFDVEDNPESEVELDATVLKQQLVTLREDLTELRRKYKDVEENCARVHQEVAHYEEKALSAESTVKALKQRIKELVDKNKDLEPLLKANEALKIKLKSFTNLETLLQGTEKDVCALVSKTPVTPLAVHQLCTYVGVLKSQLKATEEKYKKENETLLLNYNTAKQKVRDLHRELHDKKTQTARKHCKSHHTDLGVIKANVLKRPCTNKEVRKCENKLRCSSSEAEYEAPPVKRKPLSLSQKKVINNLEKPVKKDIPSDPDEVLIYPGPSKHKMARSVASLHSTGLFKRMEAPEKGQSNLNARTDIAYDVWGKSVRNLLAVSSPGEERNSVKCRSKKLY